MRIAYFLLYFVSIFGSTHAKKSRQVPGQCRSYVIREKIDNLEEISELKKINGRLELDNELLKAKLSMYENNENQEETASSICPETQPTINLESLPDRFSCDTNGKETESQCIQKLQTILQQFISVDQVLRNHQHETPYNYKKRLEVLVAGSRERETFYRRLYERSKTDLIMEQDN